MAIMVHLNHRGTCPTTVTGIVVDSGGGAMYYCAAAIPTFTRRLGITGRVEVSGQATYCQCLNNGTADFETVREIKSNFFDVY